MDNGLDRIAIQTERYLSWIFSTAMQIKPWEKKKLLPLYLAQQYIWYVMDFYEEELLLALPKGESSSPSIIEKQLSVARKYHKGPIAIMLQALLPYQRKRLVERRISFVVPDTQVFLPDLGIAFRERQSRKVKSETVLRPTAAQVVILMLNNKLPVKASLGDVASAIGTTLMSASRTSDILEAAGLIETKKEGRNRYVIQKYNTHELWEHARPLLASPVKRKISIPKDSVPSSALEAGYLALSKATNLASPKISEYALSRVDAEPLLKNGLARMISTTEEDDEAYAIVQIWKYSPFQVNKSSIVDPFSLYLSLSIDHDERIAMALDTMLEDQWLKA